MSPTCLVSISEMCIRAGVSARAAASLPLDLDQWCPDFPSLRIGSSLAAFPRTVGGASHGEASDNSDADAGLSSSSSSRIGGGAGGSLWRRARAARGNFGGDEVPSLVVTAKRCPSENDDDHADVTPPSTKRQRHSFKCSEQQYASPGFQPIAPAESVASTADTVPGGGAEDRPAVVVVDADPPISTTIPGEAAPTISDSPFLATPVYNEPVGGAPTEPHVAPNISWRITNPDEVAEAELAILACSAPPGPWCNGTAYMSDAFCSVAISRGPPVFESGSVCGDTLALISAGVVGSRFAAAEARELNPDSFSYPMDLPKHALGVVASGGLRRCTLGIRKIVDTMCSRSRRVEHPTAEYALAICRRSVPCFGGQRPRRKINTDTLFTERCWQTPSRPRSSAPPSTLKSTRGGPG